MIRGSGPPPQGHGDGALMSPSPPLCMWVGVVAPHPPLWCGVVGWARERDREREGGREAKRKREREREREMPKLFQASDYNFAQLAGTH